MFDARNFVKKGLLDAIGKMPEYWVRLNAKKYLDDMVLLEEDLLEIEAIYTSMNVEATLNNQYYPY